MKQDIFKSVVLTMDSVMKHYNMLFEPNFIQVHEITNYYEHFPYLIELDKSLFKKEKYHFFDIDKFCSIKKYPYHSDIIKKCKSNFKEQIEILENFKKHLSDKNIIKEIDNRLKIINDNKDIIIRENIKKEEEHLNVVENFINDNTGIYIESNFNTVYYSPGNINQWSSFSELIELCIKEKYNYNVFVEIISSKENRNIPYSINIINMTEDKPVISLVNKSNNFIHNEKFLSYKILYIIFNIIDELKNTINLTDTYVYSLDFDEKKFDFDLTYDIIPTDKIYLAKTMLFNSLPDIELINKNSIAKKEVPVLTTSDIKNKLF